MQIANNPLFIEDLSAEANQVIRGSTVKRHIKVKNLGNKKADIDIWIAATDEKSEPLLRWCSFSEQNPLKLEPAQDREVILYFDVPQQATPGFYNYEILSQAEFAYPGKTFSRRQQLRVSLSDRDAEFGNEPGFIIQPFTSSNNPHSLSAGESLELKVKVENRSKRVDRFYLDCPELTPDWYTIHYPESSLQIPGLVKETDGLELNPERNGEIKLILHPPHYTLAGNYFPTIRLISSNKEDLILLDVVYLQVLPNETLSVELHPLILKVPSQTQGLEIKLFNHGNIRREIIIFAKDKEEIFIYTPEFPLVRMSPAETISVPLKVKPRKWWRRPLKGKPLEFNFDIEVENNRELLLPETAKSPALPKQLPHGTLVWEIRPWWQFWLPLVLLILLALGLISIGAFLLWQQYIVKPKISELKSTQSVYQEASNQQVILQFEINNWQYWQFKNWKFQRNPKLKSIDITPQTQQGLGKKISYTESKLAKSCENKVNSLSCKNISTNTTKPGQYIFKIDVFSQGQNKPSDSSETATIIIEPTPSIPVPKIIDFFTSKKVYQEILNEQIILNWKISHPDQIKSVTLIQQPSNGSPVKTTFNKCPISEVKSNKITQINYSELIICQGVATNVTKAGDYTFKLEVISKQDEKTPADTKETDTISIKGLPSVQIEGFAASKPVYESKEPVVLKWRILNPSQVKEVKIIEQGNNGSINKKAFDLRQCTPERLQLSTPLLNSQISTPPAPDVLLCKYTIPPAKGGNYTYKLEVVSKQDDKTPVESKETDTIFIKDLPPVPVPKVEGFATNKSVYEPKELVILTWKILNPSQVKEVKISAQKSDGAITKKALDLRQCTFQKSPASRPNTASQTASDVLLCKYIISPAKAGNYTYKLEVFSKQDDKTPVESKETDTIFIKDLPPVPVPKVEGFATNKSVYEPKELVILTWKILNPSQVKEVKISAQKSDGAITKKAFDIRQCTLQESPASRPNTASQTAPDVLLCKYTISPAKAGNYTYKLEVFSKQDENAPVAVKETDTINVKPRLIPPPPKITDISSSQPFYEQAKNQEILLNWSINNVSQIKEVKLVGLGLDGSIVIPLKSFSINNSKLPSPLGNFCSLDANLNCQNVPTGAKQAGDYVFKLTVIPKEGIQESEIAKNTATIKIKPVPPTSPKIIYFKVNGHDVSRRRKISFPVSKERGEINVILSWQVEKGEDIKVELLGSSVNTEGSISYILSKPPSSQIITLKVTNKAGEEKTQSVVLETVELNQLNPTPKPSNTLPRGTVSPNNTSGTPSEPSQLSPLELPPQPD